MKERRKEENKKTKKNFLFSRKKSKRNKKYPNQNTNSNKKQSSYHSNKTRKKGTYKFYRKKIQKTETKIQKPLIIEKKLDVKNQPNIKKSLEKFTKKNNTTRK